MSPQQIEQDLGIIEAIYIELFYPAKFDPGAVIAGEVYRIRRHAGRAPHLPRCNQIAKGTGRPCRAPATGREGMCAWHWRCSKGHASSLPGEPTRDWNCIFCGVFILTLGERRLEVCPARNGGQA